MDKKRQRAKNTLKTFPRSAGFVRSIIDELPMEDATKWLIEWCGKEGNRLSNKHKKRPTVLKNFYNWLVYTEYKTPYSANIYTNRIKSSGLAGELKGDLNSAYNKIKNDPQHKNKSQLPTAIKLLIKYIDCCDELSRRKWSKFLNDQEL